jgi:membrane protein
MGWSERIPPRLHRLARPLRPLWRAARLWSDAGGMRMSAAVSFYGILSLAPLLLFLVAVLGWWVDRQVLQQELLQQVGTIIGERGTAVLEQALASARQPDQGLAATALGLGVLLLAATGVFSELQLTLEQLWCHGRGPLQRPAWRQMATLRLRGLGYVLVFGFLLLVSLVVTTLLEMLSGWAGARFPVELLLKLLNVVLGLAITAALFVGLMRLSTGPKPDLRFLVMGALLGAVLFTLGRQVVAAYLATAAAVSAYGAAGSLIVLLMWIYFSSMVLLFGAAFARSMQEWRDERDQRSERRWAAQSASEATTPAATNSANPQR